MKRQSKDQSKKNKRSLTKPLKKEKCQVEISTSAPEADFKDVTLTIEFKTGTLKGQIYNLNIDYEDYHEVW